MSKIGLKVTKVGAKTQKMPIYVVLHQVCELVVSCNLHYVSFTHFVPNVNRFHM